MGLIAEIKNHGFQLLLHWIILSYVLCVGLLYDPALKAFLEESFFHVILFVATVLITYVSYPIVVLMDPGYLTAETSMLLSAHSKPKLSDATEADGGYDEADDDSEDELLNDSVESMTQTESETDDESELMSALAISRHSQYKFCEVCRLRQPLRCKHCLDCKKCVLTYDHHCPYVGKCIGQNNHRYFLIMLWLHALWTWFFMIRMYKNMSSAPTIFDWWYLNGLMMLAFLLSLVGCFSTTILSSMHTFVAFTNQTTWEFMARQKITYLNRLPPTINPFDRGILNNVFTFCCHGCSCFNWFSSKSQPQSKTNFLQHSKALTHLWESCYSQTINNLPAEERRNVHASFIV